MGQAAAKEGDLITNPSDIHLVVLDPLTQAPVPVPGHSFSGAINAGLSPNVNIEGRKAALKGATADNSPPHIPNGLRFFKEPENTATVTGGSFTVKINGIEAVRAGDSATTCNDPPVPDGGSVEVPFSTVRIG
ncbi:MAG: hypothetical protein NXI24_00770 [bacterium]|nr:hypothetical protein [bacterium]